MHVQVVLNIAGTFNAAAKCKKGKMTENVKPCNVVFETREYECHIDKRDAAFEFNVILNLIQVKGLPLLPLMFCCCIVFVFGS